MRRIFVTLCIPATLLFMYSCGNGEAPQTELDPKKDLQETLMDKVNKLDPHPELAYDIDSLNYYRGTPQADGIYLVNKRSKNTLDLMPVNPWENIFQTIPDCVREVERIQSLDLRTKVTFSEVTFNEAKESVELIWSSDMEQQNVFLTQFPGAYYSIVVADKIVYTGQGNGLKNKSNIILSCPSQNLDKMETFMEERDKKLEELKAKMAQ